jgi:hypothetical protein
MVLQNLREFPGVLVALNARWGKSTLHVVRWIVLIGLLSYLGYSLTRLGWRHVWDARPHAVGFYLVLCLQFFVQPFADLIIYRNLLRIGRDLPFAVMLRKRFLNSVMLEYSGEAYLFFWARQNLDLKKGVLLHAVKDTNVLSAGAGLAMIWLILLVPVTTANVNLPALLSANLHTFAMIGSIPVLLCLALIIGGHRVTTLSRGEIASTFAIHVARIIAVLSLEFAIWRLSGALPSAAFCLEFVALRLVVTRLPLIPGKDMLFVGIGMAAAGFMNLSTPSVAAVLVSMTAFDLIQQFLVVGLPWSLDQIKGTTVRAKVTSETLPFNF